MARLRRVEIPCTLYTGMFPGEVQAEIAPPGQESIYVFTSDRSTSTSTGTPATSTGVKGRLFATMVGESTDHVIVDLPGESTPIGPRVWIIKGFVRIADDLPPGT